MKGSTTTFDSRPCPDCSSPTGFVKLGAEPAREICGRFGCEWDGVTLEPVKEETESGEVIIE